MSALASVDKKDISQFWPVIIASVNFDFSNGSCSSMADGLIYVHQNFYDFFSTKILPSLSVSCGMDFSPDFRLK
jgi:hypothetical protein